MGMEAHQAITAELNDAVLVIRIDRREKKNALTREMYTQLEQALNDANQNNRVRTALLLGHPDYFTSGNDIHDFLHHPPQDESSPVLKFLRTLSRFQKPLIAAANGVAIGVGTTMLLHCDYVLLGSSAKLKLPFVELGLCPEAASSLLLPRSIGYLRAAEMILTNAMIHADKAVHWGLANQISDNLEADGLALAKRISRLPITSLMISKKLLKSELEPKIQERLSIEGEAFVERLGSPEAREAFSAFLQKRPPNFMNLD